MRCRWANLVTYLQQIWSRFFVYEMKTIFVITRYYCKKSQIKWVKMILLLWKKKNARETDFIWITLRNSCHRCWLFVKYKHNNHITIFLNITDSISCNNNKYYYMMLLASIWLGSHYDITLLLSSWKLKSFEIHSLCELLLKSRVNDSHLCHDVS